MCALAFSRDGKGVATAADDRTLRLYQIEDVAGKGVTFKRKELRKGAAGVAYGASPDEVAVLTKGEIPLSPVLGVLFFGDMGWPRTRKNPTRLVCGVFLGEMSLFFKRMCFV